MILCMTEISDGEKWARFDQFKTETTPGFNPASVLEAGLGFTFDKRPRSLPYTRLTRPLLWMLGEDQLDDLDEGTAGQFSEKKNMYLYRPEHMYGAEYTHLHEMTHALHYQLNPDYWRYWRDVHKASPSLTTHTLNEMNNDKEGKHLDKHLTAIGISFDMLDAKFSGKAFIEGVAEWGATEAFARYKGIKRREELDEFQDFALADTFSRVPDNPRQEPYLKGHTFVNSEMRELMFVHNLSVKEAFQWIISHPPYFGRELDDGGENFVKRVYPLSLAEKA